MNPPSIIFGFYGEGIRDYGFLLPLVIRTIQELLPTSDIQGIALDYIDVRGLGQADKMLHIAQEAHKLEFILFHLDSDAPEPEQAYKERFAPGYQEILKEPGRYNTHIVPIIPIRMTEAWMLVDFDAFRNVVATNLTADELGFVPKPHQVEALPQPKITFEQAVSNARHKRTRVSLDDVYGPLAQNISLDRLQGVPAYNTFLTRLRELLISLHYL